MEQINTPTQYPFCELCNGIKKQEDMYLFCSICHKQFSCFFCGINERNNFFNGLPSKIYNGKTYTIKCNTHLNIEESQCEAFNCKICPKQNQ